MKTRTSKTGNDEPRTRSVLDCGGSTPLSLTRHVASNQSVDVSAHSKTWRRFVGLLVGFFILPAAFCFRAQGQDYSIDWHKIAGGGGTSTGGVYTVSGTIGQQDATTLRAMPGGNYSLTGGFWSLIAVVQTPGAPWLTITRTPTNIVVISWSSSAQGWVLEHTNTLASASVPWPQILPPYPNNDGTNSVVVTNTPPANQFFRLHKP